MHPWKKGNSEVSDTIVKHGSNYRQLPARLFVSHWLSL